MSRKKSLSPYSILIYSFILIIIIGTILLTLPVFSMPGIKVSVIDSLFITTSAVTVTGLVAEDINATFNIFGKTILIILVQLGGLGIMTFSSLIVLFIRRKINYTAKKVIQTDLNYNTLFNIQAYIKNLIKIVFLIEFTGAVCLFFVFIKKFGILKAIYYSIFHSISAFCNTGFSLFPSSLLEYQTDRAINIIIPVLIILGSFGFSALNSFSLFFDKKLKNKNKKIKMSLTARLSIIISVILIISGTVLTFLIEMFNPHTLQQFPLSDKIIISFFQSISVRTAGFQTLDLINMKRATLFLYMILMFIGASPGSTGGGIKTTTVAVISLGIISVLTNKKEIEIKRKKISWSVYNKAVTLIFISVIYITFAVFILSLFEKDHKFIFLLFEVISAFGTAGLSLDLTPVLSDASKLLISLTMFIGRVGPFTVAMAISSHNRKKGSYTYPTENIQII